MVLLSLDMETPGCDFQPKRAMTQPRIHGRNGKKTYYEMTDTNRWIELTMPVSSLPQSFDKMELTGQGSFVVD